MQQPMHHYDPMLTTRSFSDLEKTLVCTDIKEWGTLPKPPNPSANTSIPRVRVGLQTVISWGPSGIQAVIVDDTGQGVADFYPRTVVLSCPM